MRRWRKIERAAGIVTVVGCSTIRGEICLYYERMTSRREDGVVMLLCLVEEVLFLALY